MRISCYFNKQFIPMAPFVEVIIVSEEYNLNHTIDFLIDSGASTSLLLDKDIKMLGIDVTKLNPSEKKVYGIGGAVKTYLLPNIQLIFKTTDNNVYKMKLDALIGLHDIEKADKNMKQMVSVMPSLLGRDVIMKFKFMCDGKNKNVYLEGEG